MLKNTKIDLPTPFHITTKSQPSAPFRKHSIPNSYCYSAEVAGGEILFQCRHGKDGAVYYLTAQMPIELPLSFTTESPAFFLMVALREDIYITLPGIKEKIIRKLSFNLAHSTRGQWQVRFMPNKLHQTICIVYPLFNIQKASAHYSNLATLLKNAVKGNSQFISYSDCNSSFAFLEYCRSLGSKMHGKSSFPLFYEAVSQALLIEALECLQMPNGAKNTILKTKEDKQLIAEVKSIIENVSQERLTLSELAGRIGWNKDKLAKGFREAYGQSVLQFFNSVQMDKASHLLRNSEKTIEEISIEVGLDRKSFSRKFATHFGVTPMAFRRSFDKNHS